MLYADKLLRVELELPGELSPAGEPTSAICFHRRGIAGFRMCTAVLRVARVPLLSNSKAVRARYQDSGRADVVVEDCIENAPALGEGM